MSNFVKSENRRQHVVDQLALYAGTKKHLGDSTFIICPFHSEKTPSGRVFHSPTSRNPGYFTCYGCGTKVRWNELAPKLGLRPFSTRPRDEYAAAVSLKLSEDLAEFKPECLEFEPLPRNKIWRTIPTNLLRDLGAKLCRVDHPDYGLLKPKIYLPVLVNGELRGYIKARINKSPDYPAYINASGNWSKTCGLFPFDYAVKLMLSLGSTTIVLVEGPRDALTLLALGIPAVSILGTQSWSDAKSRLLELAGVETVVLMMDGDCAGIKATERLSKLLDLVFTVNIVKLWALKDSPYRQFKDFDEPSKTAKARGVALWDPCSCPRSIHTRIQTLYFST